jgi:hypothetical protein
MKTNDRKQSISRPNLTNDQVNEICNEIELQWERHLLTRFFSNSNFPKEETYSTFKYTYYLRFGFMQVKLPPPGKRNAIFNRAANGLGYWHNQNFVIRLFGIVNKYNILAYGKQQGEKIIVLLDKMRNNVGAHQSGSSLPSDDNAFRQSLALIDELFNPQFKIEEQKTYPLAVDRVVEPLKTGIQEYVRSLRSPA